jgi:ArsR family transcriptional regulator
MTEKEKALLTAKSAVLKALAHPTRLWIADQVDADFSTISKHLSVLKQAGIVEDDKRGKQVYYKLKVPCVMNFMHCVEEVIASNAKAQASLLR